MLHFVIFVTLNLDKTESFYMNLNLIFTWEIYKYLSQTKEGGYHCRITSWKTNEKQTQINEQNINMADYKVLTKTEGAPKQNPKSPAPNARWTVMYICICVLFPDCIYEINNRSSEEEYIVEKVQNRICIRRLCD